MGGAMGVKKLLAKQDAGFISLHDLLLKMTKAGDGCTLQEAAMVLCRLLADSDHRNRPRLQMKSFTHGILIVPDRPSSPIQRLHYVTDNGNFESNHDDIPF